MTQKTRLLISAYETEIVADIDGSLRIMQRDGEDCVVLTKTQAHHLAAFISANLFKLQDFSDSEE